MRMCWKSVSELASVESLKRKTEKLSKLGQYEHQQNATNETLDFQYVGRIIEVGEIL